MYVPKQIMHAYENGKIRLTIDNWPQFVKTREKSHNFVNSDNIIVWSVKTFPIIKYCMLDC